MRPRWTTRWASSLPHDALELDTRVRRKLGVPPAGVTAERCRELLRKGSGATVGQERMARILLDETLDPWEALRRADDVAHEGDVP